MPRLKGLRVQRKVEGDYVITPIFYSKRGGKQAATFLASRGAKVLSVAADVLAKLIARGNLKQ